MTRSFAGLILAGGRGERWGGPKIWARLPDGRTFLEACSQVFDSAGAAVVAATLPPDAPECAIPGLLTVPLPTDDLDMFASLRCGLEALAGEPAWSAVIVLPVDHPLVRPQTVRTLVDAEGPASIPTLEGRHGHPLCLAREVGDRICSGALSGPTLRDVLRDVGARDVPVDDPGVRINCNSPDVLERALAKER